MRLFIGPLENVPCAKCGEGTFKEVVHWCIGWWPHEVDGVVHHHNPNQHTLKRFCPDWHETELERYFVPCPACGWKAVTRQPEDT